MAASEVVGFAKTGGLADVVGTLPLALAHRGHQCAVVLPLYSCIRHGKNPLEPTEHTFAIPIGERTVPGRLWTSRLPDSDVPVYLVEQADFFERDDALTGAGLYQYSEWHGGKRDYEDNAARFIFLSRAILEVVRLAGFHANILHLNDWQTGLAAPYLTELYRPLPQLKLAAVYQRMRTLFTIHNLAYKGEFWKWDMRLTGLDWRLFTSDQLEFYGNLSFLKAGLVFSDYLSTVSPTYAREIQTPYYGHGLQGVLSARKDRLRGIVNGVDYGVWDPATDRHLAATYTPDNPLPGKAACKSALQKRLGLPVEPRTPLLGVVARLAEQKGIDLLADALPGFLAEQPAQVAILGDGEPHYRGRLESLKARHPGRVSLTVRFDEGLAHQIEAGSDLFLMPSLYEPSGLNQLYSLKYGTPPLVRATGGLADTVTDTNPATLAAGTATGFSFAAYSAEAFLETLRRACHVYHTRPADWLRVMQTGMRQDWSWDRSAAEYERLYRTMLET
jgi:starch synthase